MACSTKQEQKPLEDDRFKLPTILHNKNTSTVRAFEVESVTEIYPHLIGKYKFGDSINFSQVRRQPMSEKDYLWEVKHAYGSDSLSSDGLQIIPDYETSVAYSTVELTKQLYFPVYVVNETYQPKIFFGKDNHGFAIQEAIDTSDYFLWHPIESTGYDFCGNGRFRKKLNPKEFLVFLMPKYSGSVTTSLRIRFQIGESVFISKPFKGTINQKQFDIDKKDWIYDKLKESNGEAASFIFNGGRPKGSWN
jgi:hypothetical protein